MTNVTALTEIDALADNDVLYVRDASDSANPDKSLPASKLRPDGAKITAYRRYEGSATVPALAAGAEVEVSIPVPGAAVGDHVLFNLQAAPPANIAVIAAWAGADAVSVRFRNMHASAAYAGASLACLALVTRSVAA